MVCINTYIVDKINTNKVVIGSNLEQHAAKIIPEPVITCPMSMSAGEFEVRNVFDKISQIIYNIALFVKVTWVFIGRKKSNEMKLINKSYSPKHSFCFLKIK